MKKLGKSLIMLLLIMSMCIGLCACGSKDSGSSDDEYVDGDTIEIAFWYTYGSLGQGYLDKLVDEFNSMQDEYYISILNNGGVEEVRTKLESIDQENYPALFCGQPILTAIYENADYIKPFQDFLDADEEDWTANVYESVKASYSDLDGNMIGFPMGVSCSGWWVNVEAITAAGYSLDDLTSYEKIAEVATATVKKGICEYGLSYLCSGIELTDMMTIQGAQYVDNNNGFGGAPTKSVLLEGENKSAMKKAAEITAKLYQDNVALTFGSGTGDTAFPLFNSGKMAFTYATNSWGHYVFAAEPTFEYAFIPSTGIDSNAKYAGSVIPEGTGLYICDTGNEKEMQGAYEFIKFLAQPENVSYWCQTLGYVPYTDEAVNDESYQTWMAEYLPSAASLIEKIKNSPAELRIPYVEFGDEMLDVSNVLFENLAYDPTGDVEMYMEDAAGVMEEGLEIWLERQ